MQLPITTMMLLTQEMRAVVATAKAQEVLAGEEVEMLKNNIASIQDMLAFAGGESNRQSCRILGHA